MALFKTYSQIDIDYGEIARYMRAKPDPKLNALIEGCLDEAEGALSYRMVYDVFPVTRFEESADNGLIDLHFAKVHSKDLYKNLKESTHIVLFAATVGVGIDRLIAKYSYTEPSKSLCFEAIGNERVESLCDKFNEEIKAQYRTVPRYSPGYGDLSLEVQKDIFKILPCARIGLNLNDSLLMSPCKSVTAIIGIAD